mgnify:CR=1 FL=1
MGIKQKEENTNGGLHNTLAAGTTVKGDIVTETDFRLDGKIEGDVSCSGKIVIGPKGNVTGNIVSTNAEILGEVEGSIHVSAKLVLKATAVIKGDIFAQTLEIEPTPASTGLQDVRGKITTKSFFIIKSQNRRSVFSFNSVTSCFISDSRPYRNKTFTHVPSSKTTI